jgi:hypothetical protein
MNRDDMKPANAAASGTGSASGVSFPDPYPPYSVEFDGEGMPAPIVVSGPHTFTLQQGSGSMSVSLDRKAPDGGQPNLAITFTSIPPQTTP